MKLVAPLVPWGTACIVLWSCGGGGGEGAVKSPYKPVSETSTLEFNVHNLDGTQGPVTIKREGEVTIGGETWDDFVATSLVAAGERKTHIYGRLLGPTRISIAGYKVVYPEGDGRTDYELRIEEPVTLDASSIPVGIEQTKEGGCEVTFADNRPPVHLKLSAKYKKTTENATFNAQFGTVTGVQVFEGSMTLLEGEGWDVLDLFKGRPFSGRVFFHPTLGVLKVEVDDLPIGVAMTGQYDCGNPKASDYNTIQKVGVVSQESPTFVLNSFDCSGELDADKMRHAKMLVELRWADGEKAKTADQPLVETTFETVFGYFPHIFVPSPTSIFHPEENGQGYTYWYAYVDQAAKNTFGINGVSYGVRVHFPDYMNNPVRVTARIRYPIYRP